MTVIQSIRRLLLGTGWCVLGCSSQSPSTPTPSPVVATVTVNPPSPSLQVGDSIRLTATAQDSTGSVVSGVEISWSSSDPAITTVSPAGVVRAVSGGSAAVIATAEGVSGEANVSVLAPAVECSGLSYTRLVLVSTASQLSSAIADARPADLIQLAPGTYTGRWTLSTSGSPNAPIILCGSRGAVLDGGGTSPSPITLAVRASYWTIQGFTIRNVFQALFLIGVHGVTVKGLEIYNVGQEAIHLHSFSTHNLIDSNYVHDTGKNATQFGEGVYVGSASSKWCPDFNCQPDKTDSNQVTRNVIGPNIGAQMVDVKEGTTGTSVSGNSFNGLGGSADQDAWVNVYGNYSLVTGNTGTIAQLHGVKIKSLVTGWGIFNVFHGNSWNLGGAAGYGFFVEVGAPAATIELGCDNTVINAGSGFATVPCSP